MMEDWPSSPLEYLPKSSDQASTHKMASSLSAIPTYEELALERLDPMFPPPLNTPFSTWSTLLNDAGDPLDERLSQSNTTAVAALTSRNYNIDLNGSSNHLLGSARVMPFSGMYTSSSAQSISGETQQAGKPNSKDGLRGVDKLPSQDTGATSHELILALSETAQQKAISFASSLETEFWKSKVNGVELFDKSRIADQAKAMCHLQEELRFRFGVLDVSVDVGYHFTKKHCLNGIRNVGLVSAKERGMDSFKSFGPGIYTGNNPFAFRGYGPVGILVARLKGNCSPVVSRLNKLGNGSEYCFNTVIGNRKGDGIDPKHMYDEVVLSQKRQALPLFHFDATTHSDVLYEMHVMIQSIIDVFFNDCRQTLVLPYALSTALECNRFYKRMLMDNFRELQRKRRRIMQTYGDAFQSHATETVAMVPQQSNPSPLSFSLLSFGNEQHKQELPASTPPRIFDPTSPLWGDLSEPHVPQESALTAISFSGGNAASMARGIERVVYVGDTSLPPPFPEEWPSSPQLRQNHNH